MADTDDLYTALRNADAAGDTAGAQRLADYINSLPANGASASAPPSAPDNTHVAVQGANAGIGAAVDSVLNTPNTILNLGKAAVGATAGALGLPSNYMPDLTSNPNFAQRALTATGAIDPNFAPQGAWQKILYSAARGAGGSLMMPAASLPGMAMNVGLGGLSGGAGQATTEATGSPALGTAVGMAVPAAAGAVANAGANSVAAANAAQSANAQRDATLAAGNKAGLQVIPSSVNPSVVNKLLESIAGKAATGQQVAVNNQATTNTMAAQVLGLPPNTAITDGVLNSYRDQAAAPYREVANLPQPPATQTGTFYGEQDTPMMSPRPQSPMDAVTDLKQARFDSNLKWKEFNRTGEVAARDTAVALDNKAGGIETYLQDVANQNGRPDLIPAMNAARTQIAKSYDIERALNVGTGGVSAPALGAALDKGAPLTGNLQAIGAFQQAFPAAMREGEKVPTAGVSKSGMLAAALMASEGYRNFGWPGASAGLLPLASGGARALLLSKPYQNSVANPSYGTAIGRAFNLVPQQTPQEIAMRSLMAQQLQGSQ